MRIPRASLHIFLGILVLFSGISLHVPEDASRDGTVDLRDAVMLARDLAASPGEPDAFSENLRRVVSALSITAGLKTTIVYTDRDNASGPTRIVLTLHPDNSFLLAGSTLPFPIINDFQTMETEVHHSSLLFPPPVPPPRSCS